MNIIELETLRLRLRGWTDQDRPSFFLMNSHPDVMHFFPSILDKSQSNQFLDAIIAKFAQQGGWGLWAAELKSNNQFIGFIGLNIPAANLPMSPCVEMSWRLLPAYWGKGYATEGAKAVIELAFNQLNIDELVAFTAVPNLPSEAVMKRLGMVKDDHNFAHPALPEGHWLKEHVLYHIAKKKPLSNNYASVAFCS